MFETTHKLVRFNPFFALQLRQSKNYKYMCFEAINTLRLQQYFVVLLQLFVCDIYLLCDDVVQCIEYTDTAADD
jgi:hypothetical protein